MCLRLLITGGIGSGKSAVGAIVAKLGVPVLDADLVGHAVLQVEAFSEVAAAWPSVVSDGTIDRRALGRVVFSDISALTKLESITHPHIRRNVQDWLLAHPGPVAVESPLASVDWLEDQALVVVVAAPLELRRQRLRERGLNDKEIDTRLAAQASPAEWLGVADEVIDNSGGTDQLRWEVLELFERRRWFVTPER